MTEREKLLSGEYNNSRDPELLETYHQANNLLRKWSEISPMEGEEKFMILQLLLGNVGKVVWIEGPFYCDYGKHIFIGENTFINTNAVFLECNKIDIGKNLLIGPNVQIYTATHPLSAKDRLISNPDTNEAAETQLQKKMKIPNSNVKEAPYITQALPVQLGDNSWIGGNTVILPGVTIGSNVTVAAGSLVTKDIPDKMLAMGSPARLIRNI